MSLQDFQSEQPHIVSLFLSQIRLSRLNHAYLFYGPEGAGKGSFALQLAKAVNCKEDNDACDSCISCKKIDQSNHPDAQSILPDGGRLKIEQVRRLQQEIYYHPYEGDFKVYIIHKSHLMTVEAQNCLLKTLESPPSYAILLLLTNNKDALLSTVLSRCQRILFKGTSLEGERLRGHSDPALPQELEEENLREEMQDYFFALISAGYTEMFLAVEEIEKRYNKRIDEVFYVFLSLFRDLLLLHIGSEEEIINSERREDLMDLALKYSWEEIQRMIKITEKMYGDCKRNVSKRLALEVMWLKIRGRGGLEDEESCLGYL